MKKILLLIIVAVVFLNCSALAFEPIITVDSLFPTTPVAPAPYTEAPVQPNVPYYGETPVVVPNTLLLEHYGTDISMIPVGTKPLGERVKQYIYLFQQAGDQYGVDPNILAAICMQESAGVNYSYKSDGTPYDAWGIMQIANSMVHDFAKFGLETTGVEWTAEDRLVPEKAIPYAANLISKYLIYYDADYAKVIQGYNFGQTVTNKLIAAKGSYWLSERARAVEYVPDWPRDSYGDALYLEHVLRYYHTDIPYRGAKVRINGKLISFKDQFPIIINDSTLIPVRGVLEKLGAYVNWDPSTYQVTISRAGQTVVLPIDNNNAKVNGADYYVDVPATLINNRTMVPIRFIADVFGVQINWDQPSRTVLITF